MPRTQAAASSTETTRVCVNNTPIIYSAPSPAATAHINKTCSICIHNTAYINHTCRQLAPPSLQLNVVAALGKCTFIKAKKRRAAPSFTGLRTRACVPEDNPLDKERRVRLLVSISLSGSKCGCVLLSIGTRAYRIIKIIAQSKG